MSKEPKIIDNLFSPQDYENLRSHLFSLKKEKEWFDQGFGRFSYSDEVIQQYFKKAWPKAKEIFNSTTLVPSYALFVHYEGEQANLIKHVDDNACTYTLDFCVYQNKPWDLYVEDVAYTLQPNQALAFYGEEQEHWREAFPDPESQHVAMIFFHFVEPDHWYITKGPGYIEVMRGLITEEEYNRRLQNGL